MARPARVDMRSRKPWVLARRRLFGWKVRLLTGRARSRQVLGTSDGAQVRRQPAGTASSTRSSRTQTASKVRTVSRGVKHRASDPPGGSQQRPGRLHRSGGEEDAVARLRADVIRQSADGQPQYGAIGSPVTPRRARPLRIWATVNGLVTNRLAVKVLPC